MITECLPSRAQPVQKIGGRGAAWVANNFFLRFPKKFRSILKIF